jgi:hypothetical protein
VVIHEGLWPNSAFEGGEGINTLTGADACAPYGGAAFHDTQGVGEKGLIRVWTNLIDRGPADQGHALRSGRPF